MKNFFKLRQYYALKDISKDISGRFIDVLSKLDIFNDKEQEFDMIIFKRKMESISNYKDLLQSKITNDMVSLNQ